jgi:hypothetical protein
MIAKTNVVVLKSIPIPRKEYDRLLKEYPNCRVERKSDTEANYIIEWIDGDSFPYRLIQNKKSI